MNNAALDTRPRLAGGGGRLQTGRDSRQAGDKSCLSKRFLMQRTDFFALLQDTQMEKAQQEEEGQEAEGQQQ